MAFEWWADSGVEPGEAFHFLNLWVGFYGEVGQGNIAYSYVLFIRILGHITITVRVADCR